MNLLAFSVFDNAAEAYLPPFYVRSKGEAIRSFSTAVNDSGHAFAKSKSDYILFAVGVFDDKAGIFVGMNPERVLSATEVLAE